MSTVQPVHSHGDGWLLSPLGTKNTLTAEIQAVGRSLHHPQHRLPITGKEQLALWARWFSFIFNVLIKELVPPTSSTLPFVICGTTPCTQSLPARACTVHLSHWLCSEPLPGTTGSVRLCVLKHSCSSSLQPQPHQCDCPCPTVIAAFSVYNSCFIAVIFCIIHSYPVLFLEQEM